mgnify:CR=1
MDTQLGSDESRGPLQRFLQHLRHDSALQSKVMAAATADEVAEIAQALGYAITGSDLLLSDGRSADGVRIIRVDHPGEYPGRYH